MRNQTDVNIEKTFKRLLIVLFCFSYKRGNCTIYVWGKCNILSAFQDTVSLEFRVEPKSQITCSPQLSQ